MGSLKENPLAVKLLENRLYIPDIHRNSNSSLELNPLPEGIPTKERSSIGDLPHLDQTITIVVGSSPGLGKAELANYVLNIKYFTDTTKLAAGTQYWMP